MELEPWFFRAVDKLRRGFLWVGREDARGGNCLVAWPAVCQPECIGGLGFHNLRWLNAALRTWWLWLQKMDAHKSWAGLQFRVLPEVKAMFNAYVCIRVFSFFLNIKDILTFNDQSTILQSSQQSKGQQC